jgi:hypothetical protein
MAFIITMPDNLEGCLRGQVNSGVMPLQRGYSYGNVDENVAQCHHLLLDNFNGGADECINQHYAMQA